MEVASSTLSVEAPSPGEESEDALSLAMNMQAELSAPSIGLPPPAPIPRPSSPPPPPKPKPPPKAKVPPPPPKPVTFEGAGPQAQAVSEENCHHCDLCTYPCAHASHFAYLRASDYQFHKSDNAEVNAAASSSWQQATKEKVVYACYKCGEKHHKETYMVDGKLTSQWRNNASRSKGQHSNFHLRKSLDAIERKADAKAGSK